MRRVFEERWIVGIFGVLFTIAAWCLYEIDREPGTQAYWDWLWPWVFAAGAVLCLAHVAFPHSRYIAAWAGAFLAGSCVSRAWGLFAGGFTGDNGRTDARTIFGGTFWIGMGFALSALWVLVVMPAVRRQRRDD